MAKLVDQNNQSEAKATDHQAVGEVRKGERSLKRRLIGLEGHEKKRWNRKEGQGEEKEKTGPFWPVRRREWSSFSLPPFGSFC